MWRRSGLTLEQCQRANGMHTAGMAIKHIARSFGVNEKPLITSRVDIDRQDPSQIDSALAGHVKPHLLKSDIL